MPIDETSEQESKFRSRHLLAALEVQFALSGLRFKAGFNPDQPRISAGNPNGGQWTDSGGSSADRSGDSRPLTTDAESAHRDRTGEKPWAGYSVRRNAGGRSISRTFTMRDGNTLAADTPEPGVERYRMTLRDGARFEFATDGDAHRIVDGQGRLLSEAMWTPGGVETRPIVRPAFISSHDTDNLLKAAATLFDWLSSMSGSGAAAVGVFNATEFLNRDGGRRLEAQWIGSRTVEEIGQICEKFGLVRELADVASASSPRNAYRNEAARGTDIHLKVKNEIDMIGNDNFRAELSILKATEAAGAKLSVYGARDTIRIDVFERLGDVVCVYDLKTGKRGLSPIRIREIAANVFSVYPDTMQILILEIRPRLKSRMSRQSRTKRLLAPLAERSPDVVYVSDWMVVLPLQHVFRGIRLDMTSRKGIFRPVWTISDLLFVQTSPGIDAFIDYHRQSNGPNFYDELDEQAQSEILCRLIEEHTLPFLRSTGTLETYYRLRTHALRPIALWPPMHFRLELAMGHFEIARYLAARYRDDWFSRLDYGTVHTLVRLLDGNDHAGIAALLHEWEAVTAKNFRIEQVWEPAPFPFERS